MNIHITVRVLFKLLPRKRSKYVPVPCRSDCSSSSRTPKAMCASLASMFLSAPCRRAKDFLASSGLPLRRSQDGDSGINVKSRPVRMGHVHCMAKTVRKPFVVMSGTNIRTTTSPIACMKNMERMMADWIGPRRRIGEISDAHAVAVANRHPIARPLTIFPARSIPRDVAAN